MRWTRMLLLMVVACLAVAPAAWAETYTVTGTSDEGTCADTTCPSIRAALAAANSTPTVEDQIQVIAGNHQLTGATALRITAAVQIVGAGAGETTITANGNTEARALEVVNATASIADLALQGGKALGGQDVGPHGGSLMAQSSTVSLERVHVRGGSALSGGGIANNNGTMVIRQSLIEGNAATQGGGDGGGIINFGGDGGAASLTIVNSTIAFNNARLAGAIISREANQVIHNQNSLVTENVTIAQNRASDRGVGGVLVGSGTWTSSFTLIADNFFNQTTPSNCQATAISQGWNVETGNECGFTRTDDKPSVGDARLDTVLDDHGGPTSTMQLLPASPALSVKPASECIGIDQRGFGRPQGSGCDAGAFESELAQARPTVITSPAQDLFTNASTVEIRGTATPDVSINVYRNGDLITETGTDAGGAFTVSADLTLGEQTFEIEAPGAPRAAIRVTRDQTFPVTTIESHPPTTTTSNEVTFTYGADEQATFNCWIEELGETEQSCPASGKTYSGLANGTYTFAVRAIDRAGNAAEGVERFRFTVAVPPAPEPVASQPAPATTPIPSAAPTPTPTPTPTVNVDIVIRPTGRVLVKLPGTNRFFEVKSLDDVPLGSEIDVKNGRVVLRFESEKGKVQTATFYGGVFRVTQVGKVLDLKLTEPLAACPGKGRATATQSKAKKRKLWGDGKGSFRTSGKYSAATVRGTEWYVEDSCAGTLTRVSSGVVAVKHGKKTILVRAGKRYLAKAPR